MTIVTALDDTVLVTALQAAVPDILRLRRAFETAGAPPGALRDLARLRGYWTARILSSANTHKLRRCFRISSWY